MDDSVAFFNQQTHPGANRTVQDLFCSKAPSGRDQSQQHGKPLVTGSPIDRRSQSTPRHAWAARMRRMGLT